MFKQHSPAGFGLNLLPGEQATLYTFTKTRYDSFRLP